VTGPALDIIPLGGLGEIGLNCLALVYDGRILVIDAGLMFPDPSQLGVDLIIPDFSFLEENSGKIEGLILTHGHEDHIGALPFLLKKIPLTVLGTRLTLALARERLAEHRLSPFGFREVQPLDKLTLGPFEIEFISVSHSIIAGLGLAVTTPVGILVHTGDFKLDLNAGEDNRLDLYKFAEYGQKGVRILLSDSTNAEVPGQTLTENEVGRTLTDIFRKAPGRIILACFASSIARLRQVALAAVNSGRKLLFDGRSMTGNVRMAQELGCLDIPADQTVDIQQAEELPDRAVAVVVTGSQGEPLSALSRMALGEHRHIQVRSGDTIIFSARIIPGNEKAISHLVNLFHRVGAEVLDQRLHKVHASGHGQAEELKLMLNLTRPSCFVPIHGELRHLNRHAELAREQGVANDRIFVLTDGQRLSVEADRAYLSEPVPTGRWLVDGTRLGSPEDPVIRSRTRIAEMGLAAVTLVTCLRPDENGEPDEVLAASPQVVLLGIHYENDPDLTAESIETVKRVWAGFAEDRFQGPLTADERTLLIDSVKREVRRLFKQSISRKPMVHVQLISIPPAGREESPILAPSGNWSSGG
jgi:ribonuclease J